MLIVLTKSFLKLVFIIYPKAKDMYIVLLQIGKFINMYTYKRDMNKIILDKIDKKLLSYLIHNFREPISKISKECKISREQTKYRIKKYEKNNLILNYLTLFNLSHFGFKVKYGIKLRVRSPTIEKLKKIKSTKDVVVLTKALTFGRWDFFLNVFFKKEENVLSFISSIYNLLGEDLLNYEIYSPISIFWFPLKIFDHKTGDKNLTFEKNNSIELDELDKKIIQIISTQANIKLVDLSNKLNRSSEIISYRLKRLEKTIIVGYRIFLNLDIIEYKLSIINIKINNFSQKVKNQMLTYAEQSKLIHAFIYSIGNYNVSFQIIYKRPKELSQEISKIKELFGEHIIDYEIVSIEKELTPQTLPKL